MAWKQHFYGFIFNKFCAFWSVKIRKSKSDHFKTLVSYYWSQGGNINPIPVVDVATLWKAFLAHNAVKFYGTLFLQNFVNFIFNVDSANYFVNE